MPGLLHLWRDARPGTATLVHRLKLIVMYIDKLSGRATNRLYKNCSGYFQRTLSLNLSTVHIHDSDHASDGTLCSSCHNTMRKAISSRMEIIM